MIHIEKNNIRTRATEIFRNFLKYTWIFHKLPYRKNNASIFEQEVVLDFLYFNRAVILFAKNFRALHFSLV